MLSAFTASHRGGSGEPLVLLHGFTDTWRTWDLVLPALVRRHDVFAPTLPGHAGGPRLTDSAGVSAAVDALELILDAAGIDTAHVAGNSLGGHLALQLAARGRARSVVALAPAGGWASGDAPFPGASPEHFSSLVALAQSAAPFADALLSTPEGRRQATLLTCVAYEHLPAELLAHQLRGVAACPDVQEMIATGLTQPWELDAAAIDCPVRIVWGTEDRVLPLASAAVRYRDEWLPQAEWIELDDVGHCPQLDVPLPTSELILGLSTG